MPLCIASGALASAGAFDVDVTPRAKGVDGDVDDVALENDLGGVVARAESSADAEGGFERAQERSTRVGVAGKGAADDGDRFTATTGARGGYANGKTELIGLVVFVVVVPSSSSSPRRWIRVASVPFARTAETTSNRRATRRRSKSPTRRLQRRYRRETCLHRRPCRVDRVSPTARGCVDDLFYHPLELVVEQDARRTHPTSPPTPSLILASPTLSSSRVVVSYSSFAPGARRARSSAFDDDV
jgi:hypothetical protein